MLCNRGHLKLIATIAYKELQQHLLAQTERITFYGSLAPSHLRAHTPHVVDTACTFRMFITTYLIGV